MNKNICDKFHRSHVIILDSQTWEAGVGPSLPYEAKELPTFKCLRYLLCGALWPGLLAALLLFCGLLYMVAFAKTKKELTTLNQLEANEIVFYFNSMYPAVHLLLSLKKKKKGFMGTVH